jgi:hypothetical protein
MPVRHEVASIEIVAVPPGEAPESIRAAWVGLVLPLERAGKRRVLTSGVLTGARTTLGRLWAGLTGHWRADEGYMVDADAALDVLKQARPDAARWWSENAPHLFGVGRKLLFAASACRVVPDPGFEGMPGRGDSPSR